MINAIAEKDINYDHSFPIGIVAVFDELADLPGSNHYAENPKIQQLGTYCDGVGYEISESILDVYPNAQTGLVLIEGRGDLGIVFKDAWRVIGEEK